MSHTWPLSYLYVRCPKCGFISEDRTLPVVRLGIPQREIVCPRCHERYIVEGKPYRENDTADWRV